MELEFFGATGGVTGSCHILRIGGRQLLLDCGLLQGRKEEEARNREPFPFVPGEIDAVVLSHAHIDHSGRLPQLVKRGFTGPIYTQNASRDLCSVLLQDSAGLAERDAQWQNKKLRKGEEPIEPLYTRADAREALKQMQGLRYREELEILPGVRLLFHDAGHIMGSSHVLLRLSEGGVKRTLVYSGDIGQYDTPILNDPAVIDEADFVLMESTYGNRLHRERSKTVEEIGEVMQQARHDKGNLLIPAFAVGRSQEVLYYFGQYFDPWALNRWQVFLDSPMAIEASKVYWDYPHLYDDEATKLRHKIHVMPQLRNLHLSQSTEDSMAINRIRSGAIIIAGSGMCTGGRIIHHLKHNISHSGNHVMIVGYQAHGTLGRKLVEGDPEIRIHRQTYRVNAQVHTVGGLSAHADQDDLIRWLRGFKNNPRVYIVHGEQQSKETFQQQVSTQLGLKAEVPVLGTKVNLLDPEHH